MAFFETDPEQPQREAPPYDPDHAPILDGASLGLTMAILEAVGHDAHQTAHMLASIRRWATKLDDQDPSGRGGANRSAAEMRQGYDLIAHMAGQLAPPAPPLAKH